MVTENFAFGPDEPVTLCLCTAGCAAPIDYADGSVFIPLIDLEACNAETARILSHPTAFFVHERLWSIAKWNCNHR